jgi:ATP/maltotriose-dependent transcriptional regulator MalT
VPEKVAADSGIEYLDKAIELFRTAQDDFYVMEALTWSACRIENASTLERLHLALELQQKINEPNGTAWILYNIATRLKSTSHNDQAQAYIDRSRAAMEAIGSVKGQLSVGVLEVEQLFLKGELTAAYQRVNALIELGEARYPQGVRILMALRAFLKVVVDNDLAGAAYEIEFASAIKVDVIPMYNLGALCGMALTAAVHGDYQKLQAIFQQVWDSKMIDYRTESIWLICYAIAYAGQNDYTRAAQYLGAAEATPPVTPNAKRWFDGWSFVADLHRTLHDVLGTNAYEAALAAGESQALYKMLEDALQPQASNSANSQINPNQQLQDPLTERELQVLALMQQGFSNNDIAQSLVISTETVKVHARNIYGKLGVAGRGRAVEAARQIGLI